MNFEVQQSDRTRTAILVVDRHALAVALLVYCGMGVPGGPELVKNELSLSLARRSLDALVAEAVLDCHIGTVFTEIPSFLSHSPDGRRAHSKAHRNSQTVNHLSVWLQPLRACFCQSWLRPVAASFLHRLWPTLNWVVTTTAYGKPND